MDQVQGVDVSHWQGAVDFAKLRAQGKLFCISKADEGFTSVDNQFARSRIEAPKAGMIFGSYHFFHPKQDIVAQVNHYERVIGPRRPGELPPALDWETTDNAGLSRGVQVARALQFISAIETISGCLPFVYGSPGFLNQFGSLAQFVRYPLWVANYGVNHPRIPAPWHTYTIWQYSESNGLDLDVFNGNLDRLKAMTV